MLIRFLFCALLFSIIWGYWRKRQLRQNNKIDLKREVMLTAFFIYLLGVFFVTFEPFRFHWPNMNALVAYLVPFKQIMEQFGRNADIAWYYLIANIVMLIPFGFFIPVVIRIKSFLVVFLIGLLFSLFIELIQLFFTTRSADIDDVIFNVTGAVIGYSVYKFFSDKINK